MIEKPQPYTWKGMEFKWNHCRSASVGHLMLANKRYALFERETSLGKSEAWCEWEGGHAHTAPCVMATSEQALERALLELHDHLLTIVKDLGAVLIR